MVGAFVGIVPQVLCFSLRIVLRVMEAGGVVSASDNLSIAVWSARSGLVYIL